MRHAATPCSVPRTTQEGGHTIFSLSAIKVVPRKRRMIFFGYKLRGAAARPKRVVPSLVTALPSRAGERAARCSAARPRLEAPSHQAAL